jgi:hypothetical protein
MFLKSIFLENNSPNYIPRTPTVLTWFLKFSICIIYLIKDRSSVVDTHYCKTVAISVSQYMKELCMFINVAVKWDIELFESGSVIFHCVCNIMPHVYYLYHGQNNAYPLQSHIRKLWASDVIIKCV